MREPSLSSCGMKKVEAQPITEPVRKNFLVFRRGKCRLEGKVAGRLAQNVELQKDVVCAR